MKRPDLADRILAAIKDHLFECDLAEVRGKIRTAIGGPMLEVRNPMLAGEFAQALTILECPAPWAAGEDGSIFAANRKAVCVIDLDRELSDAKVAAIATALIVAVNTCCGLRAVRA